jgi:hypothetical protein
MLDADAPAGRFFGAASVVVVLAQTLALTTLALALGDAFQSGTTFLLPVLVLAAPSLVFGYRRENLPVLVVTNPILVVYSQLLLGFYPGGPGTPAVYAVVYAAVGLALTVPPFAAGYTAARCVDHVRGARANA